MRTMCAAAIVFSAGLATPAAAAEVDLGPVVQTACAGVADPVEERDVPLGRIAEAILFQSGFAPSRLMGQTPRTWREYEALVVGTVVDPPASIDAPTRRLIGRYVLVLAQDLGPGSDVTAKERGLRVASPFPRDVADRDWIFRTPGVRIVCMPAKTASGTVTSEIEGDAPPRIGLVKAVADLGLTGSDRRKADSATIGFKRERTEDDDGTSKTSTTVSFDGTLGLRLTGTDAVSPVFAFANYTLSRNRTRPAAALGPGERPDDKDTNGLALGLAADDVALPFRASLGGQLSYVSDYAKGSRRGVGSIVLTPGWMPTDLGFCGLGALRTIGLGSVRFRTQCDVQAEVAYSHVFSTGRADFGRRADFLSAGVLAGIDLVPPLFQKNGVVGSFRYRYLPTISGEGPDVGRIEAALKYRWWISGSAAFDFGVGYRRGEELKTYTDEDVLELAFGIVF